MVDTVRTQTALLTQLFQNGQADGSITSQDIRDLIVTLTPSVGAIYFSTPVETVISSANTKTLSLGTTSLVTGAKDVDMPQNNRIRYLGLEPRQFVVDATISSTVAANVKVIEYQLFKNGTPLSETTITRAYAVGADHGTLSLTTNVSLDTNDYIELFISNETDTTNITIENGTINLVGFVII